MMDTDFVSIDVNPTVSEFYSQVSNDYKIGSLDTSYLGERTLAVWSKLKDNFELYYETREIGGESEYDFFRMMQSCLNRNADTYERHLKVYDDDIANPVLGRTETVTYDTHDNRSNTGTSTNIFDKVDINSSTGQDTIHNIAVPADEPNNDTDRTREKTEYGKTDTLNQDGSISTELDVHDDRDMTGTVTTELSDIGVRPNYEMLNGFLEHNKTYIQFFIESFEECFAPRYKRIYF